MAILSKASGRVGKAGIAAYFSRASARTVAIQPCPIFGIGADTNSIFRYHLAMDISSRDFEAHPSLFLRRAEAGETIVVTDHGRPIAELRPAQAPATQEEAALLELVCSGLITPPARQKARAPGAALRLAGPPISEAILEDRKDRF